MKHQSLPAGREHSICDLGPLDVTDSSICHSIPTHVSLSQASTGSDELTSDHSDVWSQYANDGDVQLEDFEEEVDDRFQAASSMVQFAGVKMWNDVDTCLMTPPKKLFNGKRPWTPTANLKLLLKAASPDIRMRDMKRENCSKFINKKKKVLTSNGKKSSANISMLPVRIAEDWPDQGKRKEKSLGILCQRFLEKFPLVMEFSSERQIKLDEVADYLGVSRRRVYDIINVLEAINFAVRQAKNKYTWHGSTRLVDTITRLHETAKSEGAHEQIESMKKFESCESSGNESVTRASSSLIEGMKKSLTFLSQRFLMLFLVAPNNTLNLDLSAKVLLGDPTVDKNDVSKFKTTIRRLYDIANILTSLNLIRKVSGPFNQKSRKPAFTYTGPRIDENDIPFSAEPPVAGKYAITLRKHLSFDQICEAAEVERRKLCEDDNDVAPFRGDARNNGSTAYQGVAHTCDDEDLKKKMSEVLKQTDDLSGKLEPVALKSQQPGRRITVLTVPRRHFTQFFRTKSDGAIGCSTSEVAATGCLKLDAILGGRLNADSLRPVRIPLISQQQSAKVSKSAEELTTPSRKRSSTQDERFIKAKDSVGETKRFLFSSRENLDAAKLSSVCASPDAGKAINVSPHLGGSRVVRVIGKSENRADLLQVEKNSLMEGSNRRSALPLVTPNVVSVNLSPTYDSTHQGFQRPVIVVKRVCRQISGSLVVELVGRVGLVAMDGNFMSLSLFYYF